MEDLIQELGKKLLLPEHPTAEETQKVDAAVVMAFKRNWSVGIGLLGFQLSASMADSTQTCYTLGGGFDVQTLVGYGNGKNNSCASGVTR